MKNRNDKPDHSDSDDNEDSILWSWIFLLLGLYMMYSVVMGLMSGETLAPGAKNMSPDFVAREDSPKYYWASIVGYAATSAWLIYAAGRKIISRL